MPIQDDIAHFRDHFDAMYLTGIPRLLDETGSFLAFVCIVSAIDTLAGLSAPAEGTGQRFKAFVVRFFPSGLRERSEELWRFRNLMIHAANPGPFALVCGRSQLHLTPSGEVTVLYSQDCYAALLLASQAYFHALATDPQLQVNFQRRIQDKDGGAPDTFTVTHPSRPG
jgi:hypothetical protein